MLALSIELATDQVVILKASDRVRLFALPHLQISLICSSIDNRRDGDLEILSLPDRRFANGILAPSGKYRVTVSACNLYDLCSEKSATIKIPWYAPAHPTALVPTEMIAVEQKPESQIEHPRTTKVSPAAEISIPDSEAPSEPEEDFENPTSLLSFVVLIALMWVISSAALSDKRPSAIRAIAKTISSHKHKGE